MVWKIIGRVHQLIVDMFILVGSQALVENGITPLRKCGDLDLITTYKFFTEWIKTNKIVATPLSKNKFLVDWGLDIPVEVEIAWPDSAAEELIHIGINLFPKTSLYDIVPVKVPTLDWLFTIKSSHKYLKDNPHFNKTLEDYHWMKYDLGCKITNESWYKKRQKETYNYSKPRLNRSKEEFFSGDGITYKYDHDSLHEAVKHLRYPAYTYYMKDGYEVLPDKKKWDECSEQIKMFGVLEESYVLALERSQLAFPDKLISPRKSFDIALEKVCTSITSGWFREYAYENYFKVCEKYSSTYKSKFWEGLHTGIVKEK